MFAEFLSLLDMTESDRSGLFERFRLATTAGNEAYSEGAHERAREHFEDALLLARQLFQRAVDERTCPVRATATLLVARFNAAENLSRLGRLEEAVGHVEAGYRTMCNWRSAPHAPAGLRNACEDLLPSAADSCSAFLERFGAGADQIRALHGGACRTYEDLYR